MVVLIASGVAARSGIIFRDPQKLETARSVTDVVFDKTGTLTDDQGMHDYALPVLMTLIQTFPGDGILGRTRDFGDGIHLVRAGNPAWLGIDRLTMRHNPEERDHTILCLTVDGVRKADLFLRSNIRSSAKATIENLHRRGIRVHMITGDHEGAAAGVAEALSIPTSLVEARLKPADKKEYVNALQADDKTVMFVGDGTNDAVALKASAIGVHLNRGSDVAKSAADIVLMNPHLLDVCVLLDISRAAYRRIILNFVWSFVYNSMAVLLAAGAFRVWRIEPKYAGLGELVSVLPVVGVAFSMRCRGYGRKYKGKVE
ncbi:uncharacterized protein N0V89_000290 [Didymosphaeria variabile]|uniref:HAD-like protein n=1 Tax=Didymosphaeria variabile TaxID=1932322 RepID=A0A9W9CFJ7_9PLEO|nr:uncharacterized protein N0V89_000290 [Didymosphaeria variabile]KAJ4359734.1 hypothetical protein N0V89_000290 [Didymosphaeria variabile]